MDASQPICTICGTVKGPPRFDPQLLLGSHHLSLQHQDSFEHWQQGGGHLCMDAFFPTSDRIRSAASYPIVSVGLEYSGAADEPVLVGGDKVRTAIARYSDD